jgi:ribonucleotide reductase beta subunit family protein with ferritin-like domain
LEVTFSTMSVPFVLRDDEITAALPIHSRVRVFHDMYKQAEGCFWTVDEIKFDRDRIDWEKLNSDEQFFIGTILSFFAPSDIIVNNNLADNFLRIFKHFHIARLLTFQMMIEGTHAETYATQIDILPIPQEQKNNLLDSLRTMPVIKAKNDWCGMWTPERASIGECLVAWACVEGIFFSGAFCAIFWLKKRNLMPGLTFSNELISRDEGLHRDTSVALFHALAEDGGPEHVPSTERIIDIVRQAVDLEKEFICKALPVELIGMNSALMSEYIEFVADHLCVALGVGRIFNVANPFPWMDMISIEGKTNFFEKRVGEYAKSTIASNEDTLELDADF